MKRVKAMAAQGQPVPAHDQLRAYIMDQYVNRVLQLQLAKRFGVVVSDKMLNQQIQQILKQQGKTMAQFKQTLRQKGYSFADFKRELQGELTINQLQQQAVGSDVKVSQADIDRMESQLMQAPEYTIKMHLIDYLVPLSDDATTAEKNTAQQQAKTVAKQLQRTSGGAVSAKHTDMGWRSVASLPDVFSAQLVKQHTAGVVGPIEAGNGYHVLVIKGIRQPKQSLPTRTQISQMVYMQKLQVAAQKWLKKMRDEADIQVYH